MQNYNYRLNGTCARMVSFDLDENQCIHNVEFIGGCNGNLKGIGALVEGMPAADIADRVAGVTCGPKSTSCPDQLSRAIREALK